MRKRFVLSVILSVCLAATITTTLFTQAAPIKIPSVDIVTYTEGANFALHLPQGVPSHPVDLRISVSSISDKSDYGGANSLSVSIWVSTLNSYVPVALITTSTSNSAVGFLRTVFNGTPVWTPPLMTNIVTATANQLQVWKEEDRVIMANLTASFNVTLPATLGGSFTIPPMEIMFRPLAPGFQHSETITLAAFSRWTITTTHTDLPAWVRFTSLVWMRAGQIETSGTIVWKDTTTYTPPLIARA